MIGKDEIDKKSKELGIGEAHVQRDYLFGWLLSGISNSSDFLRDTLVLKGGNGFRKAYFENTRYSSDLDFSTQTNIDTERFREEINKICEYVGSKTGVEFDHDRNAIGLKKRSDDTSSYEAKVYFKGFYGEQNYDIRVTMDMQEYDKIFLPIQQRNIIHPYSDADICTGTIQCHKLEELLASKLKALLQRRHSPDLFDFVFAVFLQKNLDIDRSEVLRTFLQKTIYQDDPLVALELLLKLPFATIGEAWDKFLICPKRSAIDFSEAENQFKTIIPTLFETLGYNPATALAGGNISNRYYPAEYRNTLMDAGQKQKLVKMVYKGVERVIEPYSLKYKIKNNGVGKEYLYAWDITGGTSGTFTIKSYTRDNIQSMEITDKTFDPRTKIELSKAGEYTADKYFGNPFAPKRQSSTRRVRRPSYSRVPGIPKLKYIFQCSYCNKQLVRSTSRFTPKKHKDQFGNTCPGRSAFLVTQEYR